VNKDNDKTLSLGQLNTYAAAKCGEVDLSVAAYNVDPLPHIILGEASAHALALNF
jgi:hypothetical protein